MTAVCVTLVAFSVFCGIHAQFHEQRCRCVCRGNPSSQQKYYTDHIEPEFCTCENVVLTKVSVSNDDRDAFCAQCECKFSSRNVTIIKLSVYGLALSIFLLLAYTLFILIIDPLMKRRFRQMPSGYHEHFVNDENIFDDRTPTINEPPPTGGQTAPIARKIVGKLTEGQHRWREQVRHQQNYVYGDASTATN